ncbi:MAG: hypothetical protein R3B47_08270 [Bacteroidia bacterium]
MLDFVAMKAALGTVKPVNAFMKERGFDIRLNDRLGPMDIAAACVFELKAFWEEAGETIDIRMEKTGRGVPGTSLKAIDFFQSKNHPQPVVLLKNDQNINIYVSKIDKMNPGSVFELYQFVRLLSNSLTALENDYSELRCPMISMKISGEVSWLKGAFTQRKGENPHIIREAKAEHILRLNETGTLAKAAVISAVLDWSWRMSHDNPYIIDGPFVIWYEVDGVILFCAKIEEDAMKRPPGLDR